MDLMSGIKSTSGLAQLLTCKTKIQLQNPAKSVWNKLRTANNQMCECQLYFQTRMPGKQIQAKVNYFAIYCIITTIQMCDLSDSFLHYDLQY